MKVFERNVVKEFKDRIGITIKCKPVLVEICRGARKRLLEYTITDINVISPEQI